MRVKVERIPNTAFVPLRPSARNSYVDATLTVVFTVEATPANRKSNDSSRR